MASSEPRPDCPFCRDSNTVKIPNKNSSYEIDYEEDERYMCINCGTVFRSSDCDGYYY
jgi:transposase-like protein